MFEAVDDLLAEYRIANDGSSAEASATRHGYPGTDGYIRFWTMMMAPDGPRPEGYVRTDTLIAFVGGRAVGDMRLRRELTDDLQRGGGNIGYAVRPSERGNGYATAMLRAGLARAADLGIERALVTVEVTNAPSLRVVEKCGGVAIDEVTSESDGALMRRFWLDTSS